MNKFKRFNKAIIATSVVALVTIIGCNSTGTQELGVAEPPYTAPAYTPPAAKSPEERAAEMEAAKADREAKKAERQRQKEEKLEAEKAANADRLERVKKYLASLYGKDSLDEVYSTEPDSWAEGLTEVEVVGRTLYLHYGQPISHAELKVKAENLYQIFELDPDNPMNDGRFSIVAENSIGRQAEGN